MKSFFFPDSCCCWMKKKNFFSSQKHPAIYCMQKLFRFGCLVSWLLWKTTKLSSHSSIFFFDFSSYLCMFKLMSIIYSIILKGLHQKLDDFVVVVFINNNIIITVTYIYIVYGIWVPSSLEMFGSCSFFFLLLSNNFNMVSVFHSFTLDLFIVQYYFQTLYRSMRPENEEEKKKKKKN